LASKSSAGEGSRICPHHDNEGDASHQTNALPLDAILDLLQLCYVHVSSSQMQHHRDLLVDQYPCSQTLRDLENHYLPFVYAAGHYGDGDAFCANEEHLRSKLN
jgi:hypothetical protein